jgi:hypothetical protein
MPNATRWGALLLALLPFAASAHETRDVGGGAYAVEVGFRDEPAYLGQANALFVKVTEYGSGGGPVEGLAASLEGEVEKDGRTLPLVLAPGSEPGEYEARFVPTALGDYTFRVFGDIGGAAVDEAFSSSPTTFAPVEPLDRFQFPVNAPVGEELTDQLAVLEAKADAARALALGGLTAGAAGIAVGVFALASARRVRTRRGGAPSGDAVRG